MSQYASVDELKRFAGIRLEDNQKNDALAEQLVRASGMVEDATGTWWDKRQKKVLTQAGRGGIDASFPLQANRMRLVGEGQRRLFMPAPIISVTSLKQTGVALVVDVDYYLYDSWITKVDGTFWSSIQRDIEFIGYLGCDPAAAAGSQFAVPPAIKQVTLEVAAVLLGLKVRSFTTFDGAEKSVLMTDPPKYVEKALWSLKSMNGVDQDWYILDYP